jgi:COMPASS component SWD2
MMDSYQIASIIHGDDQVVDSCFHAEGKMFVTATKNSLTLIDCLTGEAKKKIFTKTHGNENVVFTHHEYCVIVSSNKTNNDIRYLSMYDNRYLRFFKGHQTQVTSIAMSPVDDYFLSSSTDGLVCLWSLASPSPVAKLTLPENAIHPKVAYTNDGLIFGVMAKHISDGSNCIRLFDAISYDKGPFLQLKLSRDTLTSVLAASGPLMDPSQVRRFASSPWQSFTFSSDGMRALVSTACGLLLSLDAYNSEADPVVCFPKGGENHSSAAVGCCFSPDSKYVLAGGGEEDKQIRVHNPITGAMLSVLPDPQHVTAVTSVKCNPKYEVIATSGINTMLWLKRSLFTHNS